MNPVQDQPHHEEDYDFATEEHDELPPSSPHASAMQVSAAGGKEKKQVIRGARYIRNADKSTRGVEKQAQQSSAGPPAQLHVEETSTSSDHPPRHHPHHHAAAPYPLPNHRKYEDAGAGTSSSGADYMDVDQPSGSSSSRLNLAPLTPISPSHPHPPPPHRGVREYPLTAFRDSSERHNPPPPTSPSNPTHAAAKVERRESGSSIHGHSRSPNASVRLPPPPHPAPFPTTSGPHQHQHQQKRRRHSPKEPSQQHSRNGSSVEGEDDPRADENVYPALVLVKEKERQSKFLNTVLIQGGSGPIPERVNTQLGGGGGSAGNPNGNGNGNGRKPVAVVAQKAPQQQPPPPEQDSVPDVDPMVFLPPEFELRKEVLRDPVELGLIDLPEARRLLTHVFEHLNPFVNLFDPVLHTVEYIRKKSPFLFTVLMMAGAKFWKKTMFRPFRRMAYTFASRAFEEQWKTVETVQAFVCLVYWKEPEDNYTWMFVGYACRLAIDVNLNTFVRKSSLKRPETELELRERRNRERTYFVLFVHDRSLSMQTGKPWMLQEDDLIRNSGNWHREGPPGELRPEDVIVAAFVALRRLSAETSDVFHLRKNSSRNNSDVNFEVLLTGANSKLSEWTSYWQSEMTAAGGTEFHCLMLHFFRMHVRLFLNSLGLTQRDKTNPGFTAAGYPISAGSLCYSAATESLAIIERFKDMKVLQYVQDVFTTMSAYAAIFMLRLVRDYGFDNTHGYNVNVIHDSIRRAADAFLNGGAPQQAVGIKHGQFMATLIEQDIHERTQRSQSAAPQSHSGPVSAHTTGVMPPPPGPLERTKTESCLSFQVPTSALQPLETVLPDIDPIT
ncbi:hypothetical protein FRB90_008303 [Tulasnella sp. 427]|nr:hypothetical protein FRB90_008303 [Tulasnella sp. 427]